MKRQKSWHSGAFIMSVATLLIVIVIAISSVANLSEKSGEEGALLTKRAVERGVALCYATEGFYPPSLAYLEENYGVTVNKEYYIVHYEIFAENIFPQITVISKNTNT